MGLKGPFRLALVTGASSGIGTEMCRLLAKEGVHLVITGRNKTVLYQIADELRRHVNVAVYPADLTIPEERQIIIRKIRELAPDLIVNNAGYGLYGLATDLGSEPQLNLVDLDVSALMEIATEAAIVMQESPYQGVIMNVSSVAGHVPFPGFAAYGASKAFVNSYSVALDVELRDKGIRVLAACPGQVETNFSKRASMGKYRPQGDHKMSASYAAKQIWKQILKRKVINVFDWKYKVASVLLHYVIPSWLAAKVLKRRILKSTLED